MRIHCQQGQRQRQPQHAQRQRGRLQDRVAAFGRRRQRRQEVLLATLVQLLLNEKVPVIDCQQNTRHLASLGAREVGRADFLAHVRTVVDAAPIDWRVYMDRPLNALLTEIRTD